MLQNISGDVFKTEQSIFPIIGLMRQQRKFRCVGTGFFITSLGGFVTARHVLYDNHSMPYDAFYGVQRLSDETPVMRVIREITVHPYADIAVGMLGEARDRVAKIIDFELAPSFQLSFKKLLAGDEIIAFGYPKTQRAEYLDDITFSFKGHWSKGSIVDFHAEGGPLVKNRCYQTNMHFDSGTSGGPVFKNSQVIGINSSSMDLNEGDEPISFITPIDLLLDLSVGSDGMENSIKTLVSDGFINGFF